MFTTIAPGSVMQDYLRPWKLMTLAAGLALLIAGSFDDQAPDWNTPIRFILGLLAEPPA